MMEFILITAIIFIIGPLIVIEGFAHWILLSFCRDDKMATTILNFALGWLGAGVILLIIYFVIKFFS
ncbi:hypothetical protein KJ766_00740 [Patescibacteria group bacterium]|nr:hypothetical protein [Patescibacteria group bacterium]